MKTALGMACVLALAGCRVTGVPQEQVLTLRWNPVESATGYRVYYGRTESPEHMLIAKTTPESQARFSFPGASPGESVCFRVKAYDADRVSDFSEAVCETL